MTGQSLRARAAGEPPGNGVAQRDARAVQLKRQIRDMEEQFKLAMPRGMEAAQLVRDAMTVLSANPKLAECEPRSVLGALMTCAQLGLRPGVLGQAWVIPFKGKGQLVIGYQGLIALAQRSGNIASISARIVYAADLFEYEFGLDERLVHRPHRGGDRAAAVAYYCVVKTRAGGTMWDVLERADAERHRDRFAMARNRDGQVIGPWVDHFDSMALKTVIMRVLKLAPRSTELQQMFRVDESFRLDVSPQADPADVSTVDLGTEDEEQIHDAELVDEATGLMHPAGAPVDVEDPPDGAQ